MHDTDHGEAPAHPGAPTGLAPGASRAALRGFTVAMVMLVLLGTGGLLWQQFHQGLQQSGEVSARRVSRLTDELAQLIAVATVAVAGVEAPGAAAGPPPPPDQAAAAQVRGALLAALPIGLQLQLLDAEGRPLPAGAGTTARVPGLPAGWPTALADGWVAGIPVGSASERRLPLWRRASANPHGIAGFVLWLDHAALEQRLAEDLQSADGLAALFRIEPDGRTTLLARAPAREADLGRTFGGPLADALAQAPGGVFDAVNTLDGVQRRSAYARLDPVAPPLAVINGMARDGVLRPWVRQAGLGAAVAAALVLGIVYVGWRLDRLLAAEARQRQALAQRELRYRTLTDHLPDVVVRFDRDGHHLYANPAIAQATGMPPQDFIGRHIRALDMPPAIADRWMATLGRAFDTGEPQRLEFTFTGPDGPRQWESTVLREPDQPGQPPTALVISRDITERHRAAQEIRRLADELEQRVQQRTAELAQSEARYRTIFDTVPVAIGEEDWSGVQQRLRQLRGEGVTDGPAYFAAHPEFVRDCARSVRIRRVNQAARSMMARHRPDPSAAGRHGLEVYYSGPAGLARFAEQLAALWQGERRYSGRRAAPARDGTTMQMVLTVALPALDDADGTALACLVDIGELDRLTAELDRSIARLRQVNQELETFTYSVSHDLKAPLRGIDGYSRLLLTEHRDRLDDEGREFLDRIRQATRHMGTLIDDLLAYSRLERRALQLDRLALAPLVHRVLAGFAAECQARGVELTVDVPETLAVQADQQGLAMALRNLVDNALKFSRDRRPPRLTVRARAGGLGVRLSVEDNGVGFDMKYHDRIFAIFQRLHRAEDYPGTGIGLAIVRKAVARMGGQVSAQGATGQGAIFTIELPDAEGPPAG